MKLQIYQPKSTAGILVTMPEYITIKVINKNYEMLVVYNMLVISKRR